MFDNTIYYVKNVIVVSNNARGNAVETREIQIRLFPDGRMDARSAAAYVGLDEKTMANYRSRGIGPKFVKRGRIFYYKVDLDEWIAGGRASSTAQARLLTKGAADVA